MKIFVFDYVDCLTGAYHNGGGLVIISENEDKAKELLSDDKCINITDKEWEDVESFDLAGDVEPKFWVMPDAGCC